jgi:hypothetical protein
LRPLSALMPAPESTTMVFTKILLQVSACAAAVAA